MEKYFKRTSSLEIGSQNNSSTSSNKRSFLEFEVESLIADPGQRPKISSYHPNDRDKVRCAYLQKGPCQPRTHDFPQTAYGSSFRRFNPNWFDDYGNWLEYSISKDAVFYLCCYLMKPETEGGDAFVTNGFSNWKKKERLQIHVGIHDSAHNQAWRKCEALMRPKQHITAAIEKQSEQAKKNYQIHLTATIDCIRFLLRQGLAFHGNDETDDSVNQGNFLELLNFLAQHNEEIDRAFKNAHGNLKLIAPSIQKDIVRAAAKETTKVIVDDLGDELFAVLVDEARDISIKEQMSVCLRYVNKEGQVREHFLGLVHVSNTNALSLKLALESLLETYNLSLSRVRGQGYDGASNMQGEFNGLKTLILKENSYAFYVHCFAHQLQLALVTVAKKQVEIALLFNLLTNLCNVVGASCKRRDMLRDSQMTKTIEALKSGEISSGRGLNQETTLKRAGDTRWGSHYGTILRLISLFSSVVNVLEYVEEDGNNSEQRAEACHLLNFIQSFEFIFNLHLMKNILGVTNELSQALQRNDQDIVNAMALVKVSKQRLQNIRDDGRSRRKAQKISNLHHFQVEIFYQVVDRQLQELNNRFTEVNTELLLCIACLNPRHSFFAFDKEKLIQLAQFYPLEFSSTQLLALDSQLENFILDVRFDDHFSDLNGIGALSQKLVETRKNIVYPLVFLLLKLALVLPVAIASVERTFFAMNIIKSRLRNRMRDEFLNDCLVTYIERETFDCIDNEKIIQSFQNMKPRRMEF
nr:zinc finger MYM-type protein 1-like [Arachis hypogaea]